MTQHTSRIQSKYWKRIPKIKQTAAVPLTNNDKWMQYAELLLGIKQGGKRIPLQEAFGLLFQS